MSMDVDRTAVAGTHATADEGELSPGTMVGEYRIEAVLGEGGFGSVYRAVHPIIGKTAAIKLLKPELSSNGEMVSRFIAEARAVNQIRHRNIVDIFVFGVHVDGRHYYVMEHLEGRSLEAHLEAYGGRLPVMEALTILRPLARALHAAHGRGIAHRDIKPENVLLTSGDDGEPIPKLLDFGIAKLAADPASKVRTAPGVQMGTPAYMAPEQVHGKPSDHRADIYSFGVMIFELLAGRLPFIGETAMGVMVKHISEEAPPLSSVAPDLGSELDAPLLRMMAKDPEQRPASILDALDDLIAAAEHAGLVPAERFARLGESALSVPGRTILGPPSSSLTPASPARSSRSAAELGMAEPGVAPRAAGGLVKVALLGGGAALALAAVITFTRARSTPAAASASSTLSTPTETATTRAAAPQPSVSPASAEIPTSSASASAPPAPATVKLTLASTPPGAEIYLGGERLGRAGEKLSLPYGKEVVTLSVKRAGYVTKQLDLTPDHDVVETVVLQPASKPKEYAW